MYDQGDSWESVQTFPHWPVWRFEAACGSSLQECEGLTEREMSRIHWGDCSTKQNKTKHNRSINKYDGGISLTFCGPLTR